MIGFAAKKHWRLTVVLVSFFLQFQGKCKAPLPLGKLAIEFPTNPHPAPVPVVVGHYIDRCVMVMCTAGMCLGCISASFSKRWPRLCHTYLRSCCSIQFCTKILLFRNELCIGYFIMLYLLDFQ